MRGPLPGGIDAGDLGVSIWQPAFPSFQSVSVSGDFSFGQNPHATFKRSNITLADDVHWVKGTHDISFGFHGELARVDVVNQNGQPGQFSFASTTTNNAMASFFLGYMSSFSQSAGQFQDNRAKFVGLYVQDSWKATPGSHLTTACAGSRLYRRATPAAWGNSIPRPTRAVVSLPSIPTRLLASCSRATRAFRTMA